MVWNCHFTIHIDDTFPLMMVGIPWVGSSSELHYLLFLPITISFDLTINVDLTSAEQLFLHTQVKICL